MTGPFDSTLKHLIEDYPADWLPLVGHDRATPVTVVDADVATTALAADKVIRVGTEPPWLLHVELQSSPAGDLASRLHCYNGLLGRRHGMPVRTLLVLLRTEANSSRLDGTYREAFPGEEPYLIFRYRVVRLWQQPVVGFLEGGTGVLPLAPLADLGEAGMAGAVRRLQERLSGEADEDEARALWLAASILAGLRLKPDEVEAFFSEVFRMRESSTYRMILDEGREEGLAKGRKEGREEGLQQGLQTGLIKGRLETARSMVQAMGDDRLGPMPDPIRLAIEAITDVEHLKRLARRAVHIASWDELFQAT